MFLFDLDSELNIAKSKLYLQKNNNKYKYNPT